MAEKPLVSPARGLPFQIYQPEKQISFLKIGIYGDPGVGKTTLAATAPTPIFINAEAGDVALRNKGVDIVRVDNFDVVKKVYDYLKSGTHEYETVVIDSLTELHRRAMDFVLKSEGRDMPQQQDWGRSSEYIRRIVRQFRDLDMHTVFILGAHFREDQMTGNVEYMPNLPGKLGPEIGGYMDILGFMVTERPAPNSKEYIRRLRVQPTPKYKAKDRTNTLGPFVEGEQLNLTRMIELVNGNEQETASVIDDNLLVVTPEKQ